MPNSTSRTLENASHPASGNGWDAGDCRSTAPGRSYGFASWRKVKANVEQLKEGGQLRQAIDREDIDRITELMIRNPLLHQAPIGYRGGGPLTWVAECRGISGPPSAARLRIA